MFHYQPVATYSSVPKTSRHIFLRYITFIVFAAAALAHGLAARLWFCDPRALFSSGHSCNHCNFFARLGDVLWLPGCPCGVEGLKYVIYSYNLMVRWLAGYVCIGDVTRLGQVTKNHLFFLFQPKFPKVITCQITCKWQTQCFVPLLLQQSCSTPPEDKTTRTTSSHAVKHHQGETLEAANNDAELMVQDGPIVVTYSAMFGSLWRQEGLRRKATYIHKLESNLTAIDHLWNDPCVYLIAGSGSRSQLAISFAYMVLDIRLGLAAKVFSTRWMKVKMVCWARMNCSFALVFCIIFGREGCNPKLFQVMDATWYDYE